MEINLKGFGWPCIAQEDIKAGLAVKLGPAAAAAAMQGFPFPDPRVQNNKFSIDMGASLPDGENDTEARYIAAFRVYNDPLPIIEGLPIQNTGGSTVPFNLTGFVQGGDQFPATGLTMRLTHPRFQEGQTIASGALMLAYEDGIYTVESGCFTAGSYTVGAKVSVHAGGIWYQGDSGRVGVVWSHNAEKNTLTIKTGR